MFDHQILPTTIVGSYPQPDWLIDRERLKASLPPRVRAAELWRIPEPWLADAQEAATLMAIRDQEDLGIDIVGDGEMRRESYSNRLATALSGIDRDRDGTAMDRTGKANPAPLVSSPIRRTGPIEVQDAAFLKRHTVRPVKLTLPGPFTMTQQADNGFYPTPRALAMDYADAVNAEIRDLFAAGIDVVQLDEPYLQARADAAQDYAIEAINRALDGVNGTTALHICFGYALVHGNQATKPDAYAFLAELEASNIDIISIEAAQPNLDPVILEKLPTKTIMYGVLDLSTPIVETPEIVADRIRRALRHIDPHRLWIAPDCGMKYHNRPHAQAKLKAMIDGAAIVRAELA
ncbi:5-methyltetrahydropteroyltriglutamate--homocysteine methyltransferase [Polymorphobacter glacialis]|uniref:5-methyltetrahydropteroyltriglutamate--homocysteine methyltransferase n=1 Tax=Sandarakinorhabdus glacialis TaxID=1614636 RepID=A0A916ZMD5_9SPHN|nr:5-methyltetrahydropteroyltriglutamate--homocysteine methyltransferase [Polymorphobacter glacialis]GGE03733.1 5-methyltetrahydropteroyltriglutamate--homocysteine methyltransferase [Polymorphobacter glacialis]